MSIATVSVVFTDLVGSTALLSRVGEETADRLRREHFALLRRAIEQHGGSEVKNLGDGLMLVFEGVGASLAAAVAMQQAMAARPAASEPLEIRVGVAVGEAESDEGDYFGLPVVEAARLCAVARGGEILVTEFVRMLARSRSGFELEHVGAKDLKGLDEPMETYRVRWTPLAQTASAGVPLQRRVTSLANPRFVGRSEERERIDSAWKAAQVGDRHAVLLSGEPGIGKTTLAANFSVEAAEHGATVLYGRCDEDLFVPYQPWIEALGHLVEHIDDQTVLDHVAACGPVLGRIITELRHRCQTLGIGADEDNNESDRFALFSAATNLLAAVSRDVPVVLVLDDLHWADEATVQLLRHLLSSSRTMNVLVLGTFRDAAVSVQHPLLDVLARLRREHGVERIALRGIGDDELLLLLERIAGHDVGQSGVELRDVLLVETEGNPFYIGEMLRHLQESGAIVRDETGTWTPKVDVRSVGLPVSIREVLGRRVMMLGAETHRVLTLASVVGRDFDIELLSMVANVHIDHVIDLCDEAVRAAVLRETEQPGIYTFGHALIQYSLYEEMPTARKVRAHRTIAEGIELLHPDDVDDNVTRLAHHWRQATQPQNVGRAILYARRAGDRALRSLAPAEALRWYADAVDMMPQAELTSRDGIELRVLVGTAERLVGAKDYRDRLVDAGQDAIAIAAGDLVVQAALAGDRGYNGNIGTVDEPFVAVVRAALDALSPDDSAERARLLGLLAVELTWLDGSPDERLRLVTDALAMARRLGDPRAFAEVVANGDEPRSVPDRAASNLVDALDAVEIAVQIGGPGLRIRARTVAATAALDMGDRVTFEALLLPMQVDVAEIRLPDFDPVNVKGFGTSGIF